MANQRKLQLFWRLPVPIQIMWYRRKVARDAARVDRGLLEDWLREIPMSEEQQKEELEIDRHNVEWATQRLDEQESEYLLRLAERWGIEVPRKPEWFTTGKDIRYISGFTIAGFKLRHPLDTGEIKDFLNGLGRTMVKKQIRDARRANIKWWIEVLMPFLALVVALLALLKDLIVELVKK